MGDSPDKGYVRAHIEAGEGFFDAGAYSFFGDMAPLDEGLGGALEDGLEAPPEELPAEERGLDDEEDLPIEDLLDTDEDEDLSLAALLRKRMQEGEASSSQATNGLSKGAVQQQQQPLMPPLPPQPQMLSSLGQQHTSALLTNQQQQAQYHQQQQQQEYAAAAAAAAAASAPPPQLPDAAAFDAVVPAPGSTPMRGKITAQTTPSNVMTAEELEARMLRSAEAPAPSSDSRGTQLLSMLKGGAAPDQQQRHASPLHAQDPALVAAQQQMQQMHMGGTSAPMMPPHPGMGPPMFPHGPPPPHLLQQQQQLGPGMMPPPHPGMGPGPLPPPEVLVQMQQQQQQRPPMMPGQQPPPFIGPPPPHQQGPPMGQMPGMPGMGMMGPGGPPPFQGMGLPGKPMGMPPQGMPPQSMPPPHQQQPMQMGMPPPGPYGFGPRGPPPMGPGGVPLGGPMDGQQQRPGMMPPQMRPGQEFMQGPGAPPLPGQLMPPGGPQPLPGGPPQQPGQGFKQQGMPPPGFPGLPAGMQQQQQRRHGSPAGMHPGGPHMQQQQQQQGQPGGPQLPLWAGPGPAGTPGARPPMPQQQQQQGGPGSGSGAVFGGEYLPTATTASADAMRVVSPAALVHKLRTSGSTWMAADDINYILRIQHMATHSGVPYVEDFYFQAFCNKYFGGRNALIFAPQQLRELDVELQSELEPRFADLAGLGRVVLSNIRTPKMLMDVGSGSSKATDSASQDQQQQKQTAGEASKARPLEQEPMLAARIMVEDCMLLLCDVEDIDRMFAATAAAGAAHASGMQLGPHTAGPISPQLAQGLLQRRAALLGGIAASFRLPDAPLLPAAAGDVAAGASGDRVFIRILALPKGRSLITKTLKLMFTPPPAAAGAKGGAGKGAAAAPVNGNNEAATADSSSSSSSSTGLDVIWALLRNAQLAFGPPLVGSVTEAEKRLTDSTIALASIASEMVKRLTKPEEAVACLAAAIAGLSAPTTASGHDGAAVGNGNTSSCQLLPLYPAGRVLVGTSPEWLGSILGSLLLRASELGLGSFAAAAAAAVKGLGDGTPGEAELLEQQAEANGPPPEVAAEWQRLLGEFVQLVQLHLWQLVQAVRGAAAEVAAAAAAGPGSSEVLLASVPKMACVPLMRVLMAHCSEEQQEQLKGYLSEVGR